MVDLTFVKNSVLRGVILLCHLLSSSAFDDISSTPLRLPRDTSLFRFRSRNVDGKRIAVLSLKSNFEQRDRRSILGVSAFLEPTFDDVRASPATAPFFNVSENPLEAIARIQISINELQKELEREENYRMMSDEGVSKRSDKKIRRIRRKHRRTKRKQNKKQKKKKKKGLIRRKRRPKIKGKESCEYRMLHQCARTIRVWRKALGNQEPPLEETCEQRQKFLSCVSKKRSKEPKCGPRATVRGNMVRLRHWIRQQFWTKSSCILNTALRELQYAQPN